MTVQEARRILEKPKFGDPDCLRARKVIEEEAEMAELLKWLAGKQIKCWCCEGRRYLNCECGCEGKYHPCHTCKAEKYLTLSPDVLRDLRLYQLRDIAKELGRPA